MRQQGFVPIGLILYAVAGVAILGALYGLYRHGLTTGRAEVQAAWDRANQAQREREAKQAATASTKLETANAKAKVVYRTNTKFVDKIVERVEYRNVCLDAVGLCIANASIRGESATACKPDKPVSPTGRVAGWHNGFDLTLDYGEFSALPRVLTQAQRVSGGS